MVIFLSTSIVLLAVLLVALYYWQKPSSRSEVEAYDNFQDSFPRSESSSLFGAPMPIEPGETGNTTTAREQLLARASAGDHSVAIEAHENFERRVYGEILTALVRQVDSDAKLLSLLTYITRNELPVNTELAQATIDSWKRSPDRGSTARTMHITALADDARLYQETVASALNLWRRGMLADVSPAELRALFDGEFWVLSTTTRNSGAGFVLKRALAKARRELESAMRVN